MKAHILNSLPVAAVSAKTQKPLSLKSKQKNVDRFEQAYKGELHKSGRKGSKITALGGGNSKSKNVGKKAAEKKEDKQRDVEVPGGVAEVVEKQENNDLVKIPADLLSKLLNADSPGASGGLEADGKKAATLPFIPEDENLLNIVDNTGRAGARGVGKAVKSILLEGRSAGVKDSISFTGKGLERAAEKIFDASGSVKNQFMVPVKAMPPGFSPDWKQLADAKSAGSAEWPGFTGQSILSELKLDGNIPKNVSKLSGVLRAVLVSASKIGSSEQMPAMAKFFIKVKDALKKFVGQVPNKELLTELKNLMTSSEANELFSDPKLKKSLAAIRGLVGKNNILSDNPVGMEYGKAAKENKISAAKKSGVLADVPAAKVHNNVSHVSKSLEHNTNKPVGEKTEFPLMPSAGQEKDDVKRGISAAEDNVAIGGQLALEIKKTKIEKNIAPDKNTGVTSEKVKNVASEKMKRVASGEVKRVASGEVKSAASGEVKSAASEEVKTVDSGSLESVGGELESLETDIQNLGKLKLKRQKPFVVSGQKTKSAEDLAVRSQKPAGKIGEGIYRTTTDELKTNVKNGVEQFLKESSATAIPEVVSAFDNIKVSAKQSSTWGRHAAILKEARLAEGDSSAGNKNSSSANSQSSNQSSDDLMNSKSPAMKLLRRMKQILGDHKPEVSDFDAVHAKLQTKEAAPQLQRAMSSNPLLSRMMGHMQSLLNSQPVLSGSVQLQSLDFGDMTLNAEVQGGRLLVSFSGMDQGLRSDMISLKNEIQEELKLLGFEDVSLDFGPGSEGGRRPFEDEMSERRQNAGVSLAGDQSADIAAISEWLKSFELSA